MDRLSMLAEDLTMLLDQLHEEARGRDVRPLMAPLAWLDEANSWLRYELRTMSAHERDDGVPFTYVPLSFRK